MFDLKELFKPGWQPQKPVINRKNVNQAYIKEYERQNAVLIFMDFLKKVDLYSSKHDAKYYRTLAQTAAHMRATIKKMGLWNGN